MSISDRLDAIEARADKATEGTWYAESRNLDDPYSLTTVYNVFHNGDTADRDLVAEVAYDNAEFIAASRTDVPALVAALRAVLDLHKPFEWSFGYGPVISCMECAERGKPEPSAEWPCPTVRAVTAALGEGS